MNTNDIPMKRVVDGSVRTSISISAKTKKRKDKFKNVNWSEVAEQAFNAVCDQLEIQSKTSKG